MEQDAKEHAQQLQEAQQMQQQAQAHASYVTPTDTPGGSTTLIEIPNPGTLAISIAGALTETLDNGDIWSTGKLCDGDN